MRVESSLAIITSVDMDSQRLTPTLQPSENELGWTESLIEVHPNQMNTECMVIPSQQTFGQSLAIPFPILLPRVGKLESLSPLTVKSDNKTYSKLITTVELTTIDIGKTVLMVPVINDTRYVIAGVEQ
ncbi:hypothetical protein EEL31_21555 [Brevibacillus laterosporus]|nr:hypothetical protein [Brevibacillus laterosporus]TPG70774.1 hypothetical protein EEL31_21555 [Brevibacillus laterosporus]